MLKVIRIFIAIITVLFAAPLFSQGKPDVRNIELSESYNVVAATSLAYDSIHNRYLRVFIGGADFYSYDIVSKPYFVYGMIVDHDGTVITPRFPISHVQLNQGDCRDVVFYQLRIDVAFDPVNQRFLVAWPDYRNGENGIYGQFLNCDGAPIGAGSSDASNFCISPIAGCPIVTDIAFDAGNQRFFVVWDGINHPDIVESLGIHGRFVDSKRIGSPLVDSEIVSFRISEESQGAPAVAFDSHNKNYLVVWGERDHDISERDKSFIKGQLLTNRGRKVHDAFFISDTTETGTPTSPELAWDKRTHRFLVVYVKRVLGDDLDWDIFLRGRMVNPNGTLFGRPGPGGEITYGSDLFQKEWGECLYPNVAYDPQKGDFVVLFNLVPFVYYCRVSSEGILKWSAQRIGDPDFFRQGGDKNGLAFNSRCGNFMMSFRLFDSVYYPKYWFIGDSKCPGRAEVKTVSVGEISGNGAVCRGEVVMDAGLEVTARGMCWSTEPGPDLSGSHTTDGKGMGYFRSVLTGLLPNTKYYVRAYATNNAGTVFGGERTFTTKAAFNVVFKAENGGSLVGDATQEVLPGQSCSPVKAVSSMGYFFVGWNGDGGFGSSFENPLVVGDVKGNMNIMAGFSPIALQGERIVARDRTLKNDIVEIDISCNPVDASLPLVFKLYRSIDGVGRQLIVQFSSADLADGHHHVLDEGLTSGRRYEYEIDVYNPQAVKVGESSVLIL